MTELKVQLELSSSKRWLNTLKVDTSADSGWYSWDFIKDGDVKKRGLIKLIID